MEKCTSYILTKHEAQEMLQDTLDDSSLELRKGSTGFYTALSDTNFLDGGEVDLRLAQALKIEKCVHFALEDDRIVVVPQVSGCA